VDGDYKGITAAERGLPIISKIVTPAMSSTCAV